MDGLSPERAMDGIALGGKRAEIYGPFRRSHMLGRASIRSDAYSVRTLASTRSPDNADGALSTVLLYWLTIKPVDPGLQARILRMFGQPYDPKYIREEEKHYLTAGTTAMTGTRGTRE